MNYGFDSDKNMVEVFSKAEALIRRGDLTWDGYGVLDSFTIWKLLDSTIVSFAIDGSNNYVTEIASGQTVKAMIELPSDFVTSYLTADDVSYACRFFVTGVGNVSNNWSYSLADSERGGVPEIILTDSVGGEDKFFLLVEVKNETLDTITIAETLGFSVLIIENGVGDSPTPPQPPQIQ